MNGKLKAIAVLTIMYALGAVSGVAWQSYHSHRWEPMHVTFAERRIRRMTSRLHLTPAQQQALKVILEKAHERATQINEEVSWDLADVHSDSVDAIRKVLTPDQVKEFDKMHHRFHETHQHMPAEDSETSLPEKATS
jgi:Spy/CpxP family protein refolding chaperone